MSESPTSPPLTRRQERLLIGAFTVSSAGDWIFRFALPLLVLARSGSAPLAAFTYAVEFVPYLVVGFVSGVVADRVNRRRLLVACDSLSAVLTGVLAALCAAGAATVPVAVVGALLLSAVRPFQFPGFQGFLAERTAPERRLGVNAWLQSTDSVLSLLGPAVGVGVIAGLGTAWACAFDAASFALSAALITCIPAARRAGAALGSIRAAARAIGPDLRCGFRVLAGAPVVLWGTVFLTVTNFCVMAVDANLPYLTSRQPGHGHTALALVFAVQGAGAVAGAVAGARLLPRLGIGPLLGLGMTAMALALLAPALSRSLPVLAVAFLLNGLSASVIVVPWRSYRMQVIPDQYMARVVTVQRTAGFALNPVGALAGGWALGALGAGPLFLCAGVLQALVAVATWLGPAARRNAPPAVLAPPGPVPANADAAVPDAAVPAAAVPADGVAAGTVASSAVAAGSAPVAPAAPAPVPVAPVASAAGHVPSPESSTP
ncbi:MFS family permease [Streptacidiphilus sp. MAP12-33]|uniref:MFS transporter n=1 Tax=Streptacidiphilus sp. MAP12-33 TaxID=3156266 RepID=UPI003519523F